MTDRRLQPRYDVVGALWGVLELTEEARIVNISATGALVGSPVPAALDSTQAIRVGVGGHGVTVEARVRHVRPEPGIGAESHYLIGVEFISPPLSVLRAVEQ